ncbi:YycH family regulatory protein [Ureibacillus sp. MALMAid1270]|uniref:YycH family regulatory protein n=1 Tax=Ureibacillus sp. MALMAid1270 TaxID=3411629 RepID=UPI003BA5A357
MGLKVVELLKSIVLTVLVLLSLVLTFSIWNYTPTLQTIDDTKMNQIILGTEKKLNDVIKPYRILFKDEGNFHGTVNSIEINSILSQLVGWKSSNVTFIQSHLTEQQINNLTNGDKRITFFYDTEVPLKILNSMLFLTQDELPEATFNRLIIDWSSLNSKNSIEMHFINSEVGTHYRADVLMESESFLNAFIQSSTSLQAYAEIARGNALSLYVPTDPIELLNLTYTIGEVSPSTFKDILFIEPSIVQRSLDSATSEKYIDGMALMTVDTNTRVLNYVYPASESIGDIPVSKLIRDSFEFINEHGGFTGDYRLKTTNASRHIVEYQLYLQGLPVFSSITSTKISTTWGDNQIFRYRRPYYFLDSNISSEKNIVNLPSGIEMIDTIKRSKNIKLESLDELYIGYYFTQISESGYTLEPRWFAIINGNWVSLSSEILGGDEYGLE